MKQFEEHLKKRGYLNNTIRGYCNALRHFFAWCESEAINPNKASLEALYNFQRHCREHGQAPSTIRTKILVIKHYFSSIRRQENPAFFMVSERPEKTLPGRLLDPDLLTEIYYSFMPQRIVQKRDKCMLGLILFQGLKRSEIESLEVDHLELEKERIYVPSTTKTNRRYLPLLKRQIEDFKPYLYEIRELLMEQTHMKTSRLFISMGGSSENGINNTLSRMTHSLKQQFPQIRSLTQIRQSVMTIWVEKYGIRKAQYLSGVKFASSMLRYQHSDTDKLKQKIAVVHPLERIVERK